MFMDIMRTMVIIKFNNTLFVLHTHTFLCFYKNIKFTKHQISWKDTNLYCTFFVASMDVQNNNFYFFYFYIFIFHPKFNWKNVTTLYWSSYIFRTTYTVYISYGTYQMHLVKKKMNKYSVSLSIQCNTASSYRDGKNILVA